MSRRLGRLATLVVGVAFVGLALPGPVAAAPSTTVTLTFVGQSCEGCVVTPQSSGQGDDYSGKSRKVRNGQVTFVVPTARTAGMSFTINTPKPAAINALPLIVMQYRGAAPGTPVNRGQAVKARSASPCWTGTDQSAASFRVRVSKVTMAGFPSGKAVVPLAWVVPTQQATGGFGRAIKGVLAGQDIWPCGSNQD